MIDIQKCKYILAIAELSSFSKAAEKLYIAQSSLSRYVSELEEIIGLKLFDRSKLPIELTYAGEKYIQYVKDFIELENKMIEEMNNIKFGSMGSLTIGTFALMGTYILPNIIPHFSQRFPFVKLNIMNEMPHSFENSLKNGSIDICLVNLPPLDQSIKYEIIDEDKILLICSINHPLSLKYKSEVENNSLENPTEIDFKDIEDEKFILLPQPNNMRKIADEIFNDWEISPSNILNVPGLNMAIDLVSANMGLTFVCKSTIKYKKLENPVIYFTVGKLESMASIIISYHSTNDNPMINKFIEISKQNFPN